MLGLKTTRGIICSGALVSVIFASVSALAADIDSKPFAEQRVLLSLSNASPQSQSAIMDIAFNLMRHYGGPDMVDIEVIVYGPGIRAVLVESAIESARIASLVDNGVRFYACGNTLDTLASREKREPRLVNAVERVPSGVAFILEEIDAGYKSVHP
jgi:intracellular sulfur oxidation DsrE/DsrF family protein